MTTEQEIKYKTTKEQCQSMINGVCSGCGGELLPLETVDNSGDPTYWAACPKCQIFDWGCNPHVFEIARKMVAEGNYIHYKRNIIDLPDGKDEAYKEYWLSSQIRGTTSLVRQVLDIHNKLLIK